MTLRRRLTLFVALAVVIPITAVIVQMLVLLGNEEQQRSLQRVEAARDSALTSLVARHAQLDRAVESAAARLATVPEQDLDAALRDVAALAGLDVALLVSPDGEVLRTVEARAPEGIPRPSVQALARRPLAPVLSARAPMPGNREVIGGVWLDRAVLASLYRSSDVDITIGDGTDVIASTGAGVTALPVDGSRTARAEIGGRDVVLAVERVPGETPAVLAVTTTRERASAFGGPVTLVLGLVLLVIVLLIVGVGYVVGGLVTQPVQELADAAQAVSRGDLERRVTVKGDVEVASLGRAFNEMTANLDRQLRELEASRKEFREAIARLGDVLGATIDLQGIIEVVLEVTALTVRADIAIFYDLLASPARVRARAVHGTSNRAALAALDLNGTGVAGGAARLGGSVMHPGPVPLDDAEPDVATAIAVPLVVGGRLHSVLAVYGRQDGGRFTTEDEETLRTLARQATVAIENAQLHAEVQQQALTDGLTGLFNRRAFERRSIEELQRAERFDDPVGIVMVDIDHFKSVNDTYDHVTGDAALIEVAARLHAAVRDIDTVARWGGEEFSILLPRADLDDTARVAERIRMMVASRPLEHDGHLIPLTVSVGYACRPVHGGRHKELVLSADRALQRAKRNGRNRVERAGMPERPEDCR